MKTIILNLAKRYLIKSVNELLEPNRENVSGICDKISKWTLRLTLIIEQLKKINARASDGEITTDEVKQSVEEIQTLIKEWK